MGNKFTTITVERRFKILLDFEKATMGESTLQGVLEKKLDMSGLERKYQKLLQHRV